MNRKLRWGLVFCMALCASGCDQFTGLEISAIQGLAKLRKKNQDSPRVAVAQVSHSKPLSGSDQFFQEIQHHDPRSVVAGFLEGIKRGDSQTLQRLLTARAMAACESSGLRLSVPAEHPLAVCRVLQADYLPGDSAAAHVRCLWSDTDSTGNMPATEVIFVLRDEESGWRIAGLVMEGAGAADVFDLESVIELESLISL